jgi:hypothetical protein
LSFYVTETAVWPGDGSAQICDLNLMDLEPGWVHLALTFELGSVPLFYINGAVQTSTDWNSSNDHDVSPKLINPEVAMIGKDTFNQTTLTNTKIDNVKFFDTALTAEEVLAVYNETTAIEDKPQTVAAQFELNQNYPNPFNPNTKIEFMIEKGAHTVLKVYDVLGQTVATLIDANLAAGSHVATFDGSNMESGVYFYQLTSGNHKETKKMMLVK